MNEQNDVIEIDLREIFTLLVSRIWILLISTAVTATAAFLISYFLITPTFEATTKIYILSKQNGENVTYSDLQLGSQLTKDYAQLITSRFVLEQVIGIHQLEDDYEELYDRVEVVTPADTRILAITVTDKSPIMAKELADAIREAASTHITNVMDVEAVNVVEQANLPDEPAAPNILLFTLVGAAIGMVLSIAVILIRFLIDDSIKTSDDVTRYLDLSTLTSIPIMEEEKKRKRRKKSARDRNDETEEKKDTEYTSIQTEDISEFHI